MPHSSKPRLKSTTPSGPQPEVIKNLFASISNSYDRTNHLITLGMLNRWRKQLVHLSGAQQGNHILDCATGTGDLAIAFKKCVGPHGQVIGSDFCEAMLDKAPRKAKKLNLDIKFEVADVTQLPYADRLFDIVSIGYGIRNVVDPHLALKEMARVTKPGGKVMILETGDTYSPLLKPFIRFHFNTIVPFMGKISGGDRSAYEYLNNSSSQFPCGESFIKLMRSTGKFKECECFRLFGGASYIYRGTVS